MDLLPGHLVGGEPRPNSAPASSFMMESEVRSCNPPEPSNRSSGFPVSAESPATFQLAFFCLYGESSLLLSFFAATPKKRDASALSLLCCLAHATALLPLLFVVLFFFLRLRPISSFSHQSLPAFDTVIERKPSAFTTPPRTKLPSGLPGVYQFYSAIFHKRSLHGKTMGDFESAFAAMDLNGDGVLSREEFRRACKDLDLGLSPSQVAELLNHMDKDNSGDIDIHEFIRELKEAISQGGYDPNAIAAEKVKGRLAELGFGFVPPRPASAPEGTGSGARGGARGNRNRQKGRQGSQGSAGAGGAGRRRGRPGSAAAATSSRRQQGGQQQQRKGQQQQQQQQQQRGGSRGRSADSRRRGGDAEDAAAGPAVREISFPESGSTQKPLELRHECQECRGRQMPKLFNCTCGLSVLGHTVYADNEPGECQCFESEKDKKKRLAREKKERQRLEAEKRRKEMQRRMRARQQEEQDKLDAASSRQSLYVRLLYPSGSCAPVCLLVGRLICCSTGVRRREHALPSFSFRSHLTCCANSYLFLQSGVTNHYFALATQTHPNTTPAPTHRACAATASTRSRTAGGTSFNTAGTALLL